MRIKTTAWQVDHARKIKQTTTNTFPAFDPAKLKQLMPGYQAWDNWAVRDEDGFVADVLGFTVLIALVRPVGADFSQGERIAFFYSKDGCHYKAGGFLFGDHQLYDSVREWSGSTVLRNDGTLQTFYTVAHGAEFDGVWQTVQRIATAIQNLEVVGDDLVVSAPVHHALLGGACEPDGILYETPAQASAREAEVPTRHRRDVGSDQTENNCMRDPFFYKDKRTGEMYLLFEGNTGHGKFKSGVVKEDYVGRSLRKGISPTEDMLKANGCIGVIHLTNAERTYGEFYDPWLVSNLVTDEIERINVINHQGHVYLFCAAHGNKNALNAENPDLVNRDYMLGFRASRFGAKLVPLNGSGVVVQQKSGGEAYGGQAANQQYVYSWLLVPTKGDKSGVFRCLSYSNYCEALGTVSPVMNAGPSVFVKIDGLQTKLVGMAYDILPE